MAGDPEKRFQKIMDKLYHAPKPKPPVPSGDGNGSMVRGRRPEPCLKGTLERRSRIPTPSLVPALGPTPQCRPWDRGDLMRRLATFKALTWFGKPKSVSPVNCARRGWINTEMDVIVCEACGARLLFSAPSSWTLQQVEKTAAVFSLKLDNGHKLLCPWIDNACDEVLALFPPTPPAVLVEGYKERASTLLRLTALPLISSSAIYYMKSPQLEHFLSQSFHPSIALSSVIKLTDGSGSKDLESTSGDAAANIYYQAMKIISLCGWEPRLLPYAVDLEDQSSLLAKSTYSSESSARIPGQEKDSIIVYSSSDPNRLRVGKIVHSSLGEYQYDPACIVLDCRFCGACVGLWAFSMTQRPLELFRLIADFSGQNEPAACGSDVVCGEEAPRTQNSSEGNQHSNKGISHTGYVGSTTKERSLGLNVTIGGGPPPTKQNFRPTVSFPIISRHLRAEFGNIPGAENYVRSDISSRNQVNAQCNDDPSEHQKDTDGSLVVRSEGLGSLKRKRSEDEEKSSDCEKNEEKTGGISSEGRNYNLQEIHLLHDGSCNIENSKEAMQNRAVDLHRSDTSSKDSEKQTLNAEREADNNVEVVENQCTTSNASETIRVSEVCENKSGSGLANASNPHDDSFSVLDSLHHGETTENDHLDSSHNASCSATSTTLSGAHSIELANSGKGYDFKILEGAQVNNQKANGLKNMMLSCVNKAEVAGHASGNDLKTVRYHKMREFDPIRQHRPFCPWIAPENGESMPGWKLTLSAVIRQQNDSSRPSDLEGLSTPLDEVDDPIVSIRKLFMSPPTKRLKSTD